MLLDGSSEEICHSSGSLFTTVWINPPKNELVVIVTPRSLTVKVDLLITDTSLIHCKQRHHRHQLIVRAIRALSAMGTSAWAVDSAPLRRAEPMPFPEAVEGVGQLMHAPAGVPRADQLSGCRPGWRTTAPPGPGRCGEVVFSLFPSAQATSHPAQRFLWVDLDRCPKQLFGRRPAA